MLILESEIQTSHKASGSWVRTVVESRSEGTTGIIDIVTLRVEFYSNDLGTFRGSHGPIKRFTYAMTRGSLQDGAGSNAIWNITNVTRSDRHFLYTTPAWAKAQSEDKEVISYIKEHGESPLSILHPYYADGTDEGIAARVNEILSCSSIAKKETFDKYLFNGAP